jgi:D-serine deaminase-like pyridoxal phosphate-dependent protein
MGQRNSPEPRSSPAEAIGDFAVTATSDPAETIRASVDSARRISSQISSQGKLWSPELHADMPVSLLVGIAAVTLSASCRNVAAALAMAQAGFRSIVLLRPIVDSDALSVLTKLCRQIEVTVVVDHFRHVEFLSRVAVESSTPIRVLIEVDLGNETIGVRPGPDSVRLAQAAATMPGIEISGVCIDDHQCLWDPVSDSADRMTFEDCVNVGRHCQRMIRNAGVSCPSLVAGRVHLNESLFNEAVTRLLIPIAFVGNQIPSSESSSRADVIEARVISRPSLEWCVVAVGTHQLQTLQLPVGIVPAGATIRNVRDDVTTLDLSADALDLRIGDTVRFASLQ